MKIAIGIGELSGDIFAASLIQYIKSNYPNIEIIGITGPNSFKQGLLSNFNISSLSKRGFFEVLFNLRKLTKFRSKFLDYLNTEKPDIYIGIDAPDFNFFIEKKLKSKNVKVFHYVCPSVWAWRSARVTKFNSYFDHLFTIFFHEKKFLNTLGFKKHTYVGHPLANEIPFKPNYKKALDKLKIDRKRKIVALLPGSRNSEVIWNTKVLIGTAENLAKKNSNLLFLIPVTSKENLIFINKKIYNLNLQNIKIIHGHSHDILNASDIAVIASGTATLEAVFYKTPMVVFYKLSSISYWIFKLLLKSKFISLPNILSGKNIVPELIHKKANVENLSYEIERLLKQSTLRKKQIEEFKKIHKLHMSNTNELICKKLFSK
ncbi:lipid-A-disaccharide synthase [beta proteobacterium KB13]|uniref:Lipid-A-disaccharide synthase n=1 Tax=beta proteobacterium KB13 TaxID=314607 RepID=B6BTV9_9PROT|nr:lipid-A-disaccharide synthase [beta proteobacterium KB13]